MGQRIQRAKALLRKMLKSSHRSLLFRVFFRKHPRRQCLHRQYL